ncbi:ATP-binding protein [Mycoplasmatota bacterium WC44]
MNELSLHILDIAQNSITANASVIEIEVNEDIVNNELYIKISDDGIGMSSDVLENVRNPFYTSRTTRKVGLGISLFELSCIQSNGDFQLESQVNVGTKLTAKYEYNNIDRAPLGNIVDTIYLLSINESDVNIIYKHIYNQKQFVFNTNEIKEVLDGVSLKEYSIMKWMKEYLLNGIIDIKD